MNPKVLVKYFSVLCIINNGLIIPQLRSQKSKNITLDNKIHPINNNIKKLIIKFDNFVNTKQNITLLKNEITFDNFKYHFNKNELQIIETNFLKLVKNFNNISMQTITIDNINYLDNIIKQNTILYNWNYWYQNIYQLIIREITIENLLKKVNIKLSQTQKKNNIKLDKYCTFGTIDENGYYREYRFTDNSPVYLKNSFTNEKIIVNGKSTGSSKEVKDDWLSLQYRYIANFNNCETALILAQWNKTKIEDIFISKKTDNTEHAIPIIIINIWQALKAVGLLWKINNFFKPKYYLFFIKGYIFSQKFLTTNDIYQVSNKLNNGITIQYWWKRFSYDWIGLFPQDKLGNGDEIKFHYVSDIDKIRYHTWTDCWGGQDLIQIVPFTEKTAEQNWLRKTYDKSPNSFYSHNSVINPQHYFLNNNDVSLS